MKKILLACGSGIATSTAVRAKVENMLNENGFSGQYEVTQCSIQEAVVKSSTYDFLVATTVKPEGLQCDFVSGVPYLTGVGVAKANEAIIELMKA